MPVAAIFGPSGRGGGALYLPSRSTTGAPLAAMGGPSSPSAEDAEAGTGAALAAAAEASGAGALVARGGVASPRHAAMKASAATNCERIGRGARSPLPSEQVLRDHAGPE